MPKGKIIWYCLSKWYYVCVSTGHKDHFHFCNTWRDILTHLEGKCYVHQSHPVITRIPICLSSTCFPPKSVLGVTPTFFSRSGMGSSIAQIEILELTRQLHWLQSKIFYWCLKQLKLQQIFCFRILFFTLYLNNYILC